MYDWCVSQVLNTKEKVACYYDSYGKDTPAYWQTIRYIHNAQCTYYIYILDLILMLAVRNKALNDMTGKTGSTLQNK